MSLQPETPSGLNHLVLNVRDLDRAHRFWTECLGFRHVGSWSPAEARGAPDGRMRFYSGEQDGQLRHHDIALVEAPDMPSDMSGRPQVFNHVAITYPSHDAWRRQIRFLMSKGLALSHQTERGATYSVDLIDPDGNEIELVCERPRAFWAHDIGAALNHAVEQPLGS
jgi:catechol 2,3-dioxygenase